MGHVSFGGRRAAIVGLLLGTLSVGGGFADDAGEIACLEAEWQAAAKLAEAGHRAIWGAVDASLARDREKLDCQATWGHVERFGGNVADERSWLCKAGNEYVTATFSFEPIDDDSVKQTDQLSLVLPLMAAFAAPEFQNELNAQLEKLFTDLAKSFEDIETALNDAGYEVEIDLDSPEPEPEPKTENSLDLSTIKMFQLASGLTVRLDWLNGRPDELAELNAAAEVLLALRAVDRASTRAEGPVAEAAKAARQADDLLWRQVALWSYDHFAIDVSRFAPFGVTMDAVGAGEGYVSVYDLKSWTQTPFGQDADAGAGIEGVNEILVFATPQMNFDLLTQPLLCGQPGGRACTLAERKARTPVASVQSALSACFDPGACHFTALRWINNHIALKTHIASNGADPKSIEQFAQSLLTFKSKAIFEALQAGNPSGASPICKL
jgi:hypothetical protein